MNRSQVTSPKRHKMHPYKHSIETQIYKRYQSLDLVSRLMRLIITYERGYKLIIYVFLFSLPSMNQNIKFSKFTLRI